MLRYMAAGAVQMAGAEGADIPIALHLDHGDSFELAKSCIDSGFSSVMLDGSHHPFDCNRSQVQGSTFKVEEWILIKKMSDRIYRIIWIERPSA